MLNCPVDALPTGLEDVGGLFPLQTLCPVGQLYLLAEGHLFFTIAPRQILDLDPVYRAGNPARRILEENLEGPNWDIFK